MTKGSRLPYFQTFERQADCYPSNCSQLEVHMRSPDERLEAISAATARGRLLIAARKGVAMDAPGDQVTVLVELARAFDAESIPYALIGGIAVGIYTMPRATDDIDVAVSSTSRDKLLSALTAAGFVLEGEHEHSLNFGHPSGERVQLAIDAPFDAMIDRAESIEVRGVRIRVVRKDDLIEMKERAARDPARRKSKALRDQADVELLRGDIPEPDEGW